MTVQTITIHIDQEPNQPPTLRYEMAAPMDAIGLLEVFCALQQMTLNGIRQMAQGPPEPESRVIRPGN